MPKRKRAPADVEPPNARPARLKAPVDVETHCSVELPQGGQCARSLACKSHSMGAKRGVRGRSAPFDQLLQQYQGHNQDQAPSNELPVNDDVHPFTITSKDNNKETKCERRGTATASLIFTHGAGGGLSNAATKEFADGFAEVSSIVSFQGNMNLKARVNSFNAVIEHEGTKPALGGRSMGARAAVLAASQSDSSIEAVVLASFPLVGAQKGGSREQSLLDLPEGVDVLFIAGSKDSMCDMDHLWRVIGKMKARSWVVEVQGADHGMEIKPKAGVQPIRRLQGTLAAKWLESRDESKRYLLLSWNDGAVESSGWQEGPKGSTASSSSTRKSARQRKSSRK